MSALPTAAWRYFYLRGNNKCEVGEIFSGGGEEITGGA
jgi:hypothetical protein